MKLYEHVLVASAVEGDCLLYRSDEIVYMQGVVPCGAGGRLDLPVSAIVGVVRQIIRLMDRAEIGLIGNPCSSGTRMVLMSERAPVALWGTKKRRG